MDSEQAKRRAAALGGLEKTHLKVFLQAYFSIELTAKIMNLFNLRSRLNLIELSDDEIRNSDLEQMDKESLITARNKNKTELEEQWAEKRTDCRPNPYLVNI